MGLYSIDVNVHMKSSQNIIATQLPKSVLMGSDVRSHASALARWVGSIHICEFVRLGGFACAGTDVTL
jgi:hypothetical protein